jgi:hypothetical protein
MRAPKIKCPECSGNGEVVMPAKLRSAYNALRKTQPATVAQISKALGAELSLTHHFVQRLVKVGAARKVQAKMPARYSVLDQTTTPS